MKYEKPEVTALIPAINAVQSPKRSPNPTDGIRPEVQVAYEDWEE